MSPDARAVASPRRIRFLVGLVINGAGVILLVMLAGAALPAARPAFAALIAAIAAILAPSLLASARSLASRRRAPSPIIPSPEGV